MSEKWWALRVKRTGDFFYLHPDELAILQAEARMLRNEVNA